MQNCIIIFILQTEDNVYNSGETGNENKGSSCVQGPRGPPGSPGLEVRSRLFPHNMVIPALISKICLATLALSLHYSHTPPTV